jgi:DNA-binding NtrC family response regulator
MRQKPRTNILLVHQNQSTASKIQNQLELHGYNVERVTNDEHAVNGIVTNQFDVLVTELQSQKIDGFRVMTVALDRNPTMPVIFLAGADQTELALQALDNGAEAYHKPPLNIDAVERSITQGLDRQSLQYEIFQLRRQLDTQHGLPNLVGRSRALAALHDQVRQSAMSSAPTILIGESGTGRDHLAKTIHNQSPRANRTFVKVAFRDNDATALDRILFGHGAEIFSDTPKGQAGQIEVADEGTLYLDNICDLSQIHLDQLVSMLDSHKTQRLGESRKIPVDVRLIVSVTPSLEKSDPTNMFLETLQQQFGALTLEIPALRDRIDDIVALAKYFVDSSQDAEDKSITGIEGDALQLLTQYEWPGNLRELSNVIREMVESTQPGMQLAYASIPIRIRQHPQLASKDIRIAPGTTMQEAERIMIEHTMKACNFDKVACAESLGIGLRTLYRKLNEYED